MPLPPLCGPISYGSTIGIRSTLDSDPHLPPYYISVPDSSSAISLISSPLPRYAAGKTGSFDDTIADDVISASAAVTVASTPSLFASPPSREVRGEQSAHHSSRLLPLGCSSNHPYRESAATEFCILNANNSASGGPVCECDEVFLVAGPSLRDFLLPSPSQQQFSSSLRHHSSVTAHAHTNSYTKCVAAQKDVSIGGATAATSDNRRGASHLLWVVCCPSKSELHEHRQQQEGRCLERSPPFSRYDGAVLSKGKDGERQHRSQQEPADDEEPVRIRSVACADINQLQRAANSNCRWRVLRHNSIVTSRHGISTHNGGAVPFSGKEEQLQQHRQQRPGISSTAITSGGNSPLRWDEEIYIQNVHNGCFLSVRHCEQRPWLSDIVALSSAVAWGINNSATTVSQGPVPSGRSISVNIGSADDRKSSSHTSQMTGVANIHLHHAVTQNALEVADKKHSSWRFVLSGIAASPWWNRQYSYTLMAPTEIDDCLLRRETVNGIPIAAYLQAVSNNIHQSYTASLRGTPAARGRETTARASVTGGWGSSYFFHWLQQQPTLALSPYFFRGCSIYEGQHEGASGTTNGAGALGSAENCYQTNYGTGTQNIHCFPMRLADSWRQASVASTSSSCMQHVGDNEWVMRKLQRDWKYLPREVKERFLLEDLLFCYSGLDGTLVRVFAVQETCCYCCGNASSSSSSYGQEISSRRSSCSTSDSSRRGISSNHHRNNTTRCEDVHCKVFPTDSSVAASDDNWRTPPPSSRCIYMRKRTLPQFQPWLHPLLTGAPYCGGGGGSMAPPSAADDAGGMATAQHPGHSACAETFFPPPQHSMYMYTVPTDKHTNGDPFHTSDTDHAFNNPSPEDYAFCQILPSLMPVACSLRLLLVFLELAGRSQSTSNSNSRRSKQGKRCFESSKECHDINNNNDGGGDVCSQKTCGGGGEEEAKAAGGISTGCSAAVDNTARRCGSNNNGGFLTAEEKDICNVEENEEEQKEEGGGEVLEALCFALRKVVEEVGIQVGVWEGDVRRGRLTLQGLRAQLSPVARALSIAEQVARSAFNKRGGSILNAIEEVQRSIPCNDTSQDVCRFLFEKAAAPLVRMVDSWIHRGRVADPYDEFFIRENTTVAAEGEPIARRCGYSMISFTEENIYQQQLLGGINSNSSNNNYRGNSLLQQERQESVTTTRQCCLEWSEQRFLLVPHRIPNFLKLHARDILHAGMYVYVLKSCKWPVSPVDIYSRRTPLPPQLLLPLLPRACMRASKGLMQLFFTSHQLLRTIELLHAFFLGGRGDFYQSFFDYAAASTPAAAALAGGAAASAADAAPAFVTATDSSAAATSIIPPVLLLRQRSNSSKCFKDKNSPYTTLHNGSNTHGLLLQLASLESSMQQAIRSLGAPATHGGTGRFDGLKDKLVFFMHPVASLCEASQLLLHIEEGDNMLRLLGLLPSSAIENEEQHQQKGGGNLLHSKEILKKPSSLLTKKPISPSDWHRRLCLRYRCGWPLSLIYSSKALCSYETIFRLLLHFNLAQRQLNHLWAHLHASRSLFSMKDTPPSLKLALALGEEMRFFLRNLLFYASTDVIAHHYGIFLRQMGCSGSDSNSTGSDAWVTSMATTPHVGLPAGAAAAAGGAAGGGGGGLFGAFGDRSPARPTLLQTYNPWSLSSFASSSSVAPTRLGGLSGSQRNKQRHFFASVVAAVSCGIPSAAAVTADVSLPSLFAKGPAATGAGATTIAAGIGAPTRDGSKDRGVIMSAPPTAAPRGDLQFQDVQRMHAQFLDHLLRDLFLKDLPLLQALSKSLTICLVFSRHALKFVIDAAQKTVEAAAAAAVAAAAEDIRDDAPLETTTPRGPHPRLSHELKMKNRSASHNSSKQRSSSATTVAGRGPTTASSTALQSPSLVRPISPSTAALTGGRSSSPSLLKREHTCRRLLIKDARRDHLRSAVSTPGYISMTRSAYNSFRTYTQEFLTKLQAFSRRDPASVSEHLLCRLDFNGRFSRPCVHWLSDTTATTTSNNNNNKSSSYIDSSSKTNSSSSRNHHNNISSSNNNNTSSSINRKDNNSSSSSNSSSSNSNSSSSSACHSGSSSSHKNEYGGIKSPSFGTPNSADRNCERSMRRINQRESSIVQCNSRFLPETRVVVAAAAAAGPASHARLADGVEGSKERNVRESVAVTPGRADIPTTTIRAASQVRLESTSTEKEERFGNLASVSSLSAAETHRHTLHNSRSNLLYERISPRQSSTRPPFAAAGAGAGASAAAAANAPSPGVTAAGRATEKKPEVQQQIQTGEDSSKHILQLSGRTNKPTVCTSRGGAPVFDRPPPLAAPIREVAARSRGSSEHPLHNANSNSSSVNKKSNSNIGSSSSSSSSTRSGASKDSMIDTSSGSRPSNGLAAFQLQRPPSAAPGVLMMGKDSTREPAANMHLQQNKLYASSNDAAGIGAAATAAAPSTTTTTTAAAAATTTSTAATTATGGSSITCGVAASNPRAPTTASTMQTSFLSRNRSSNNNNRDSSSDSAGHYRTHPDGRGPAISSPSVSGASSSSSSSMNVTKLSAARGTSCGDSARPIEKATQRGRRGQQASTSAADNRTRVELSAKNKKQILSYQHKNDIVVIRDPGSQGNFQDDRELGGEKTDEEFEEVNGHTDAGKESFAAGRRIIKDEANDIKDHKEDNTKVDDYDDDDNEDNMNNDNEEEEEEKSMSDEEEEDVMNDEKDYMDDEENTVEDEQDDIEDEEKEKYVDGRKKEGVRCKRDIVVGGSRMQKQLSCCSSDTFLKRKGACGEKLVGNTLGLWQRRLLPHKGGPQTNNATRKEVISVNANSSRASAQETLSSATDSAARKMRGSCEDVDEEAQDEHYEEREGTLNGSNTEKEEDLHHDDDDANEEDGDEEEEEGGNEVGEEEEEEDNEGSLLIYSLQQETMAGENRRNVIKTVGATLNNEAKGRNRRSHHIVDSEEDSEESSYSTSSRNRSYSSSSSSRRNRLIAPIAAKEGNINSYAALHMLRLQREQQRRREATGAAAAADDDDDDGDMVQESAGTSNKKLCQRKGAEVVVEEEYEGEEEEQSGNEEEVWRERLTRTREQSYYKLYQRGARGVAAERGNYNNTQRPNWHRDGCSDDGEDKEQTPQKGSKSVFPAKHRLGERDRGRFTGEEKNSIASKTNIESAGNHHCSKSSHMTANAPETYEGDDEGNKGHKQRKKEVQEINEDGVEEEECVSDDDIIQAGEDSLQEQDKEEEEENDDDNDNNNRSSGIVRPTADRYKGSRLMPLQNRRVSQATAVSSSAVSSSAVDSLATAAAEEEDHKRGLPQKYRTAAAAAAAAERRALWLSRLGAELYAQKDTSSDTESLCSRALPRLHGGAATVATATATTGPGHLRESTRQSVSSGGKELQRSETAAPSASSSGGNGGGLQYPKAAAETAGGGTRGLQKQSEVLALAAAAAGNVIGLQQHQSQVGPAAAAATSCRKSSATTEGRSVSVITTAAADAHANGEFFGRQGLKLPLSAGAEKYATAAGERYQGTTAASASQETYSYATAYLRSGQASQKELIRRVQL